MSDWRRDWATGDPDADEVVMPPPSQEYQDAHGWKDGKPPPNGSGGEHHDYAGLPAVLSAQAWVQRDLPPPERLLGDLLTTTSRVFLVGQTGLGKTMLGIAIAIGMALGTGFLHWRSGRQARVLYVDGEMPAELMKARLADAARQAGCALLIDNLFVYSQDWAEALVERYPMLGTLAPLNTEQGQNFIRLLCDIIRPDAVIFDNVQALVAGDMKDELPWSEVLPLVAALTARRIGQVWLDHTGWNNARQYGSATKAWRFDTVGVMTPLPDDGGRDVAFTLSFDSPGKARRRTPANWHEFAPQIIRLREDGWTGEPTDKSGDTRGKVPPSRKVFHDALIDAIAHAPVRQGETTHLAWESECIRRDLIERIEPGDTASTKRSKGAAFRAAKSELQAAHWIGVDGERVMDLTRAYR